jgi:hypothetical protein
MLDDDDDDDEDEEKVAKPSTEKIWEHQWNGDVNMGL